MLAQSVFYLRHFYWYISLHWISVFNEILSETRSVTSIYYKERCVRIYWMV